jgi:hypothetical protein
VPTGRPKWNVESGGLSAFYERTSPEVLDAIRSVFSKDRTQPTQEQKDVISRWVTERVMGGGEWQSADKVIKDARDEETDAMTDRSMYGDDPAPGLGEVTCPDCGQKFKSMQALGPHRRHRHGHEAGPPAEKPKKTAAAKPAPSKEPEPIKIPEPAVREGEKVLATLAVPLAAAAIEELFPGALVRADGGLILVIEAA